MAAKNEVNHEPLTEKQKEDLRVLIPLEKAMQFISNLQVIIRTPEFNDWEIYTKSTNIKNTSLNMQFKLKESAIERTIDEQDPNQKKIDDFDDPEAE